jgi:predicted ribosomally synthesized peptide with SipW-like signal peptide
LLSAAVLVLGIGVIAISSLALFTDTATVGSNQFTTGTVDIATTPASAVVTMPVMAPGDQVTAPLTVSNDGSLDLRYALSSTTDEDTLAGVLVLTVKTGVTDCTNAGFAADGSVQYQGQLGSVAGTAVLGDNAPGAQAGDRTLAAATNEVLCLNVELPSSATNAVSGLSSTATFTFDAEQTANNP